MAINFLRGEKATDPDELYAEANSMGVKAWIKEHLPNDKWIMDYFDSGSANLIWAVLEHLADVHLNPEYDCYFKGITGYKQIETLIKTDKTPVMIGTRLTGAGHIILLVGIEEPYFVCHDPYGDANTGYKSGSGEFVRYSYNFLWPKVFKDRALMFRKC